MNKVRLHDEAFARANDLFKLGEYEEAAKHAREAVRLAGELGVTEDSSTAATLLELIENERRVKEMAACGDISRLLHDLGTTAMPQAIKALERIGEPAVPALSELITDSSADIKRRGVAAWILGSIGGPKAVDVLLVLLEDKNLKSDKYATRNVIFALENLPDGRIADALKPFLQDRDADVRTAAEIVSEKHGVRKGKPTHMTQPTSSPQEKFSSPSGRFSDLRDPDCLKRAERAIRIGKQKSEDAVDQLIAMLRSKITFMVGKEQSEDDVGKMIAVFLSEGFFIEQAALSQALGRIGDKRALPVLRETLRALRDKPYLINGLAAWSIQGTKAMLLPESFRDLDEDVNGIYANEQAALHADDGKIRQVFEVIVNSSRKGYFFRSVLLAVAQLGESEDIAEITPFLTWTQLGAAFLEAHTAAADALVVLLDRLPAGGCSYDELKQLETAVRRSKEHATKQGWRTEEHTDKTIAAVGRKHRALRKQLRTQAQTSTAQDTSPRSWWKFWN
jgi:HEAT repeat protein